MIATCHRVRCADPVADDTVSVHTLYPSYPAKAGIQYAAALEIASKCRRLLDRPPSRMMTGEWGYWIVRDRSQCASSQLFAARASTCSGTDSSTAGNGASCMVCCTTGKRRGDLVVGHLEDQFVMHLQQHLRRELLLGQRVFHPDHGAADDVGGGALQAAR